MRKFKSENKPVVYGALTTKCVRREDTVARLGGDEFVVMLDRLHADRDDALIYAETVAEKIRLALAKPYVLHHAGATRDIIRHHCTASIGLTLFSHETCHDEILKRADMAMYQAKNSGRNLVKFLE